MTDIEALKLKIREFAERRDWTKFHNPKNLAMAISGEAGELVAEFQWLTLEKSLSLTPAQLSAIEFEIADIAIYLIRLSDTIEIDLVSAIQKKMKLNEERFPQD